MESTITLLCVAFTVATAGAMGCARAGPIRRLEPPGRKVLHGAGQSPDAFADYWRTIGPDKPSLYMTYLGLNSRDIDGYFRRLRAELASLPSPSVIPQIGLSMTRDGTPEEHYEHRVAAGELDDAIERLCEGLASLDRPAFVRIGYEFNGRWNGYRPDSYRVAYARIAAAIRRRGLSEVATVWCYAPDPRDPDFMQFYPGDEWVDWWSLDLFDTKDMTAPHTIAFMNESRRRGFPVMIGESTPRRVGVLGGAKSWDEWFAPYFAFIHAHPNVKAFCYIAWDWSKFPMWRDWGDARPWMNTIVLDRLRAELADPMYVHAERPRDAGSEPASR